MKKSFFSISIAFLFLVACKQDNMKQQLIDKEVNNAVESFRQRKLKECRAMALDSANKLADSIILVRNTVEDPNVVKGKPIKPTAPIIKSALDTTPVVPLFKK